MWGTQGLVEQGEAGLGARSLPVSRALCVPMLLLTSRTEEFQALMGVAGGCSEEGSSRWEGDWARRSPPEVWLRVCSVAQSCPTLYDPMDGSLSGFSVHGILQAKMLEWVAMPSPRGSS